MAAFNISVVVQAGRLTHDPELKTTPSGVSVCSFTIATNRRTGKNGDSKADFIDCVAWRDTAEFITKYFRKASSICVVGSLQQRSWEDREGKKRSTIEIQVDTAHFVDAKSEMPGAERERPVQAPYIPDAYLQTPQEAPKYEDLNDSEELPF